MRNRICPDLLNSFPTELSDTAELQLDHVRVEIVGDRASNQRLGRPMLAS